ncbi:MAG: CHASE2 domain-containing protein [Alphaproteobacteria bacterium]
MTALLAALSYAASTGDAGPSSTLRHILFDSYQQILPRARISAPVTIVAIDEASLAAIGQWPWPRDKIAELLRAINRHGPAAIGVDILFVEPDRLSPNMIASGANDAPPAVRDWLARRPSNDTLLAAALTGMPVALGIAGLESATGAGPLTAVIQEGPSPLSHLRPYAGLMRSLPEIDASAMGHGLLSADPDPDGIVRRTPLAARTGGVIIPSLELEMLRLAVGANWITLNGGAEGAQSATVGDLTIPVQPNGMLWVHYGHHDPSRFVSASAVLDGSADPEMLKSKLVLVGVTGLGLIDQPATPLVSRMAGVEIRAQILEAIFDNDLLRRPAWTGWAEAGLTFLFCGFLSLTIPVVRPRWTPVIWLAGGAMLAAAGFSAFALQGWLIDIALPWLSGAVLFLLLLAATLAEADQQRRIYKRDLEVQREKEAKFAGELEAARRIQMGILPDARLIRDPRGRIDIAAFLEPAREVGGDLYDLFLIDEGQRLFLMIGDVAGKGIPASLFMALGKSLYKSALLRSSDNIAAVMTQANAEIARDNSEQMFITAFAGILDMESGVLHACNAGHDAPLIKAPGELTTSWHGAGGPPMCVLDDFEFPGDALQLSPGTAVILFTDGVTEAMDPDGRLYGHERLTALLDGLPEGMAANAIIETIHADVKDHANGAEASDDITLLVMVWRG